MAEEDSSEEGSGMFAIPDLSPLGGEMKKAGEAAKGFGLNVIARRAITGYFATKFEQLRPDQLQTVLDSGDMLADMIDEDNELIRETTDLLSTFGVSEEETIEAMNRLITPKLVMETVKEANQEAYNQIMTEPGAGKKFFINQTKYLKQKIVRILGSGRSGQG